MTENPLVTASELMRRQGAGAPVTVLDVRFRLVGRPGADDYAIGHVPGAVFLDLDRDLSGAPGKDGRHPLPDPGDLQEVLRLAGVRTGVPTVVYDTGAVRDGPAAARVWWSLRWAGIPDVAVLDGGFPAWLAAGGPVTADVPHPERGDVVVRPGHMPVLDADGAVRTARDAVLLDVRAPERYRGEHEPIDPVAGHIPGAVNVPATASVDADGRFLAPAELRDHFAAHGVRDGELVGAYCGSGVTAAHTVLALTLAGHTPALYVGSWSNWVADPERPVV